MAKKGGYKFLFDSPVTVCFVLASLAIILLDSFAVKGKVISAAFLCNGHGTFNFKAPLDYVRMIFHEAGAFSWHNFFITSTLMLAIGPTLEERYGSLMLGLMIFITSLVSGVLTASVSPASTTGSAGIVFMMIFLASMTEFTKKNLHISIILLFLLFMAMELSTHGSGAKKPMELLVSNIGTFVELAGGVTGSLFGFLVCPKKRSAPKKKSEEPTVVFDDTPKAVSRTTVSSGDETIIGTLS